MPPDANPNPIGIILAANGEVYLRSAAGMRQAETGSEVFKGEELVTGAESNAEIQFADDTLLSQGADSVISLDEYIFDDSTSEADLLFKMTQGTFRVVTGKIAEKNPDRFKIGTPLATIGIRGTTIVSEITPGGGEKIGVEEIHSGKALLVQSINGDIRMISSPRALIEIAMSGQLGTVRPMTVGEYNSFREVAPSAIRQEQEIRQQQQEENQDDQQDDPAAGQNADDQEQNGEEQNSDQGNEDGQQNGEGGETGGSALPGQGVLDPGLGAVNPAGGLALNNPELQQQLEQGVEQNIQGVTDEATERLEAVAQEIFNAADQGNLPQIQQLLTQLQSETDILTTDLDETLPETNLPGSTDGSDLTQDQTSISSDGITYIYDTQGINSWVGTDNNDYYDGLDGDDYISGQMGNDALRGGSGNDVIYGDCGDDSIDGGIGNDVIYGGSGNDYITGGLGTDILSFADAFGGVNVYIGEGSATTTLDGSNETDTFTQIEGLEGSSYDDTLSGHLTEDNTFYGSPGNDLISGLGGDNWLSYEGLAIEVTVDLSVAIEQVTKGAVMDKDTIDGINNIIGTGSSDTITGNSSVNTLIGGDGGDTITGGWGADYLSGGLGADRFVYTTTHSGEGSDTIDDFVSGTDKFVFDLTMSGFVRSGTSFVSTDTYDHTAGTGTGLSSGIAQFVYDSTDHQLWYDSNGSDSGGNILIANLTGDSDTLVASDLDFITSGSP